MSRLDSRITPADSCLPQRAIRQGTAASRRPGATPCQRVDAGFIDRRSCVCAGLMPYHPLYLRLVQKLAAKVQRLRGLIPLALNVATPIGDGESHTDQNSRQARGRGSDRSVPSKRKEIKGEFTIVRLTNGRSMPGLGPHVPGAARSPSGGRTPAARHHRPFESEWPDAAGRAAASGRCYAGVPASAGT